MGDRWTIATAITALVVFGTTPVSARMAHEESHLECFGLEATIVGTSASERVVGTASDDVIVGLGGDDDIWGLDGNDTICGGDGEDDLYGNGDSDLMRGGSGNDDIEGDGGDDRLLGNAGGDYLQGGGGRDVLRGSEEYFFAPTGREAAGYPFEDRLYGDADDDLLMDGGGIDILEGGTGRDAVAYGGYVSVIDLRAGVAVSPGDIYDRLGRIEDVYANVTHLGTGREGEGGDPIILGDDGPNMLIGSIGSDHIDGRGGDDWIDGYCTTDGILDGGLGDHDVVAFSCALGPLIADMAIGQAWDSGGVEVFENFEGLVGGSYNDQIFGNEGSNLLVGGWGEDLVSGRGGEDVLAGSEDHDVLDGGLDTDLCLWGEDTWSCESFGTFRPALWPQGSPFPVGYRMYP